MTRTAKKIIIGVATAIGITAFGFLAFYHWMNSEKFQVLGTIIPRVETNEKVVALTFDDGPNEHTDEILAVLKEKDAVGTFYLIGQDMEQFPDETKRIVAAGHELGNHSYSHQRMIFKPRSFIADEITKTDQLIRAASYSGVITFRPPYGKKLIALPQYLAERNKKTITWDVEPQKALGADVSADRVTTYVKRTTKPGSIILIHPWYGDENQSRDAIGPVIDALKADGYQFVTVTELLTYE